MATLAAHPHPEDGFAGMEVRGDTPHRQGERRGGAAGRLQGGQRGRPGAGGQLYRGFTMSVSFDAFRQEYMLLLKGQMTHRATLGSRPPVEISPVSDNALSQMPQRLEAVKNQLDNLYQQQAAAKRRWASPSPRNRSCGINPPGWPNWTYC